MKANLLLFMAFLLSLNRISGHHGPDWGYKKRGLHLMISAGPAILHTVRHNPANFFYSRILVEPQFNFERYTFGLGLAKRRSHTAFTVNNQPYKDKSRQFSLMPTCSYLLVNSGRWQVYTGLGLVYNYADTLRTISSDIEVITKRSKIVETGCSVFGRIHYRISKRISLALELPLYLTRARTVVEENYPLTPSMSSEKKGRYTYQTMFFIPSNIFLRLSI